jgi:hypothetical protein
MLTSSVNLGENLTSRRDSIEGSHRPKQAERAEKAQEISRLALA